MREFFFEKRTNKYEQQKSTMEVIKNTLVLPWQNALNITLLLLILPTNNSHYLYPLSPPFTLLLFLFFSLIKNIAFLYSFIL